MSQAVGREIKPTLLVCVAELDKTAANTLQVADVVSHTVILTSEHLASKSNKRQDIL